MYGHRTCHRLFMLPQGKLRRSQFSQKSSLGFSFCYFIFCWCSVNLYMLMRPLQRTYGHMVEKTPCWMANDAVRPWKEKTLAFWKMSSLCILCPTASLPSSTSGDKLDVVKYFISSRSYGQGRVRQTASNELLFPGLSLREVTIPWQLLTITVECKIYRHLIVKDFPTARIILDGF